MDKLEEAFNAVTAHIDLHASKGPFNGFVEVAKDLGMELEDLSDGSDIHQAFTLNDGAAKLTLIYLLVPVDEDEPTDENYWLELSGRGTRSHAKVWHFKDGKLADKEPIPKAA